jgi:hypothetical protein
MAKTFLTLDFGKHEETAQQARHQLDIWRQAFHLNKKLEYKFERAAPAKGAKKEEKVEKEAPSDVRIIIQMQFSDHEKLSQQRWVERINAEEPFKSASPTLIRHGEAAFDKTKSLFESLE